MIHTDIGPKNEQLHVVQIKQYNGVHTRSLSRGSFSSSSSVVDLT